MWPERTPMDVFRKLVTWADRWGELLKEPTSDMTSKERYA